MTRFPRPLLLCLVLAAASVAGCGSITFARGGTPEAKTAQNTPQAAFIIENAQSTTPAPTRYASPTVNEQGTAVMAIATANERNNQLQRQLVDANNAGKEIERKTADSNAQAEKYKLAQLVEQNRSPIELENAKAARIAAENKQKELDAELMRLQIEREQGAARNAAIMLMADAIIFACYLMWKAMNRPHIVMEALPAPEPYQSPFSTALDSERTSTRRDLPAGVDEAHLIQLAQRVLTKRRPNGVPFSRQNWLHLMPRAEWEALVADMLLERRAYKTHPNQANSGVALTDNGEGWLYLFEQLQPIPQDGGSAKSSGMSSGILPRMGLPTNGGGGSDHFNILKPAADEPRKEQDE